MTPPHYPYSGHPVARRFAHEPARSLLVAAVGAELTRYDDAARAVVIVEDPESPDLAEVQIRPDLGGEGGYDVAAFLRGYEAGSAAR